MVGSVENPLRKSTLCAVHTAHIGESLKGGARLVSMVGGDHRAITM